MSDYVPQEHGGYRMAITREALDMALDLATAQNETLWDQLEHRDRIAADAVAAERDACAQECDKQARALSALGEMRSASVAEECAAAIRSRGEK